MKDESTVRIINVDDALYQKIFSNDALSLSPIDKNLPLSTPLNSRNIIQGNVGNCYFLSALASIIDTAPDKVKNILQFYDDKKKFRVTFYNNEGSVSMIYQLQATVVMQKQGSGLPFFSNKPIPYNSHKDPRISLLEKAFALHRVMCIPDSVVYNETFNPRSYASSLNSGLETEAYEALLHSQSEFLSLDCLSDEHSRLLYDRSLFKEILDILVKGIMKISEADSKEQAEIEYNTLQHNLIDLDLLSITDDETIISNTLLTQIQDQKIEELSNIGTDMLLLSINLNSACEESRFKELKTVYSTIKDKGYLSQNLQKQLDVYNQSFSSSNQRGHIIYNDQQNQLFRKIHTALTQKQPCSLGTQNFSCPLLSSIKGSNQEHTKYKGLVAEHAYQIIGAYSKNGAKYLLLRNPHAGGVRVYTPKPDNGLAAHAATQVTPSFWSQDAYNEQENSILTREQFTSYKEAGGVFEVEFNDLCKHRCDVVISQEPAHNLDDHLNASLR